MNKIWLPIDTLTEPGTTENEQEGAEFDDPVPEEEGGLEDEDNLDETNPETSPEPVIGPDDPSYEEEMAMEDEINQEIENYNNYEKNELFERRPVSILNRVCICKYGSKN